MVILLLFITGALVIVALTMLMNVFVFPRLRQQTDVGELPFVSVLIPARNESAVIAETVQRHLAQDYPNFEVIVLDDHSDDYTGAIAATAANGDPRLRVVEGVTLPSGWIGKSWACHNLAQHAHGKLLVFTDADVQWQPTALRALINAMERDNIDLYTVWPTQVTETWPERLTVPLIALVILGYLPIVMTHYSSLAIFGAANGQCMVWRREAYQKIGGHTAVAANVLDDVTLARRAKQFGYRLRMADGAGLISTRMYHNWPTVRDGFAKNILAGYGNSVVALLLATVFHWLIFVLPWVLLLVPEYRWWAFLLVIMGLSLRALSAAFTRQRILDALLMPFSVILMTVIAAQSIWWHYTGGPRWKGRTLSNQPQQEANQTWIESKPSSSSAQASAD